MDVAAVVVVVDVVVAVDVVVVDDGVVDFVAKELGNQ